jgi:hypothetical protein
MTGVLMVISLFAGQAATAVSYHDVPPEVERVVVYEWHERAMPVPIRAEVIREGALVHIRARPGLSTIVTLVRRDGAYLLDGPFEWPAADRARSVDGRWRHSVSIGVPPTISERADIDWLSPNPAMDGWPRCVRDSPRASTCWGVDVDDVGIAIIQAGRLWWSLVAGRQGSPMESAAWGRLLIIRDDYSGAAKVSAAIQYPVEAVQRIRNLRLGTGAVPGAKAVSISPRAVWICGEQMPNRAWVQVRGVRAGPVYVPLQDLVDASVTLPAHVVLDETRAVEGLVFNARDGPAGRTLITMFRLLPSQPSAGGAARDKPSRVFIAEVTAQGDGEFRIDGLGEADYEIVAWHSQFGRASVRLGDTRRRLEIHLQAPGVVRGRVLSGGRPLSGVAVVSAPDPLAARDAEDLVDLKGGDAQTGADGRFMVSVAAAGGGELRIGGAGHPVRRIPLPASPTASLDIGDIELGLPIDIVAVLDDDPGCGVRAVGPVGRSGVQMVIGTRTGPGLFRLVLPEPGVWEFSLLCGTEERAVSPGVREIGPEMSGKELRFRVR